MSNRSWQKFYNNNKCCTLMEKYKTNHYSMYSSRMGLFVERINNMFKSIIIRKTGQAQIESMCGRLRDKKGIVSLEYVSWKKLILSQFAAAYMPMNSKITKFSNMYLVEKVIKTKANEVLVCWKSFPKSSDIWIGKRTIVDK
ncbi:hypothetical protein PR048_017566 [Dryococelus australis]|uniref:Uncharacterized protein n=1 Tax=Dryococelus australis TaxID=614101 RepID=A0ABQ9HAG1_9NEOP|nr:hypothetical protein PR048_017566 [Dryococelus australis]